MTKNELRKLVPHVRFSGKKKTVYCNTNQLNMRQENYIKLFCDNSGYKFF
jgi:hypothetical protein